MQTLPVIQFGPDTIDECAKGSCSHCGLCCTVMSVTVPSERGKIDSAPMHKGAGIVCPQLIADARGRYLCALHESKAASDPRLADCAAWNGGGNGALQIRLQAEEWIKRPPDREAVSMIEDLIRRNLYAGIGTELDERELPDTVEHYVIRLGCVPEVIFGQLEIRDRMRELFRNGRTEYECLDRRIWTEAPDLYADFFHAYVWSGSSPYDLLRQQREVYSTP
jgi:hypothetical protein